MIMDGDAMGMRRLVATAVAVVTAAAGGGCSASSGGGGGASPTARVPATIPADPAEALAAARAQLGRESARFGQDIDGTSGAQDYTGIVNAQTKNWEITGKEYVLRRVGDELYVRADGETLDNMLVTPATAGRMAAGAWAHTRLPVGRELTVVYNDNFPWNLANPAKRATGMTKTDERAFSGSFVLKDTRPVSRPHKDETVRLRADLDEQGRFSRISLDFGGSPQHHTVFSFSDYGVPADIAAPPAAEVAEEENPFFLSGLLL